MSNTLQPYPTELAEAANLLYDHVSGGPTGRDTAVHASYQIVGVGVGKFYPDKGSGSKMGSAAMASVNVACCDDVTENEGKDALEKCCKHGVRGIIDDALLKTILGYAMKKILEWLTNKPSVTPVTT